MVSDFGKSLSERIYSYNSRDDERYDREGMIMRSVWDSFAGGNTAASVAHKIEQALQVRERNGVVIETCREDLGVEYGHDRCNLPADFIVWGKLLPPEALGPRCYEHAAKHVGDRALGRELEQWAIFDLRGLHRNALDFGGREAMRAPIDIIDAATNAETTDELIRRMGNDLGYSWEPDCSPRSTLAKMRGEIELLRRQTVEN